MEWWQIVLLAAIVAMVGVAGEVYLRLAPQREKRNMEIEKAKATIRNVLNNTRLLEEYKDFRFGELHEIPSNVYVPKKLRRELSEIIDLINEYGKWRYESYQIINAEIRAQSKLNPILDETFMKIFHVGFEELFSGVDGSRSEGIYSAIYKGILTFEIAKELILKDYWGHETIIHTRSGEERKLFFKDIMDGKDSHRFFSELIKLQERESIKILRDTQNKLLEKVRLILKEAPHANS